MEHALTLWIVILAVGAINYASRLSFIAFFARRSMPPMLARALQYVPAAMLTALIVPMIAVVPGASGPSFNPRIAAAVIAAAVAWRTKSTPKTIVAGMASLWLVEAALARFG
jgi:branched-subunit amino acid transport protein